MYMYRIEKAQHNKCFKWFPLNSTENATFNDFCSLKIQSLRARIFSIQYNSLLLLPPAANQKYNQTAAFWQCFWDVLAVFLSDLSLQFRNILGFAFWNLLQIDCLLQIPPDCLWGSSQVTVMPLYLLGLLLQPNLGGRFPDTAYKNESISPSTHSRFPEPKDAAADHLEPHHAEL